MIEDMGALNSTEADRQELRALVDHIPAGDLPAARKILRALADPVWQSILTAPFDDEPETEQERAEVEAARSEKGSGTSHEEVLREFGV
jgi:DNA-binding GntR family transcriptional regulator